MAVKKRNKVWNGLNVVEEVDTETGVISIKSQPTRSNPDGSVLANSAADGSWSLKNETEFRTLYNNAQRKKGSQPLTEEHFKRQFNQGGVPEFNRDRAEVLNNRSNYGSEEEWNRATKSFLSAGTPLIKNRETGEANNSNGETTTITQQEEVSIVESISFDPIYFNEKPISEGQAI